MDNISKYDKKYLFVTFLVIAETVILNIWYIFSFELLNDKTKNRVFCPDTYLKLKII